MFGKKKGKENPSVKDLTKDIYSESKFGESGNKHMPLPSRMPTPPVPHGVEFKSPYKSEVRGSTSVLGEERKTMDAEEILDAFGGLMQEPINTKNTGLPTNKQYQGVNELTGSSVVKDNKNVEVKKGYIEPTTWEEVTPKIKPVDAVKVLKDTEEERVRLRKDITGNYNPENDKILEGLANKVTGKLDKPREKVVKDEKLSKEGVTKIALDLNIDESEVVHAVKYLKEEELKVLEETKPKALEPVTAISRSNPMSRLAKRKGKVKRKTDAEIYAEQERLRKAKEEKAFEEERKKQELKDKKLREEQEAKRKEEERLAEEKRKHEEKERLEKERLEKERLEKERLELEKKERERKEKEKLERERLERLKREEEERLEKERLHNEKIKKENEDKKVIKEVKDDLVQEVGEQKEEIIIKDMDTDTLPQIEYSKYTFGDIVKDNSQALMVAVYTLAGTPVLWYMVNMIKDFI